MTTADLLAAYLLSLTARKGAGLALVAAYDARDAEPAAYALAEAASDAADDSCDAAHLAWLEASDASLVLR